MLREKGYHRRYLGIYDGPRNYLNAFDYALKRHKIQGKLKQIDEV